MSRRNPATDVPRRIDHTVLKRINKHLENSKLSLKTLRVKKGEKTVVKYNFNEFLALLLDVYDALEASPKVYVNKVHLSLEEARGEAMLTSVKNKEPVKWPTIVVQVGKDE